MLLGQNVLPINLLIFPPGTFNVSASISLALFSAFLLEFIRKLKANLSCVFKSL